MFRLEPSTVRVARCAARLAVLVAVATPGVVVAQSAAGRFPVTEEQRLTASQVAQSGVPLSALAANAPDTYTVKRGDTLWDISNIFLTSPWRWPELWGMNKEQIANPHLIYPGQTLRLVKGDGVARLEIADAQAGTPGGVGTQGRFGGLEILNKYSPVGTQAWNQKPTGAFGSLRPIPHRDHVLIPMAASHPFGQLPLQSIAGHVHSKGFEDPLLHESLQRRIRSPGQGVAQKSHPEVRVLEL